MSVISFISKKGGSGKTTASLCTAYELAKKHKVMLIDADIEGGTTTWRRIREEVMKRDLPPGLSYSANATPTLHKDIKGIIGVFDYIIIDAPGGLSDVTRSAIGASDLVVLPCTPSTLDLVATQQTLKLVRDIAVINEKIKYAVMMNRRQNTLLSKRVKDKLIEYGNDFKVLESSFTLRVIFAEVATSGFVVQEIDKEKKASAEISNLASELLEILGN